MPEDQPSDVTTSEILYFLDNIMSLRWQMLVEVREGGYRTFLWLSSSCIGLNNSTKCSVRCCWCSLVAGSTLFRHTLCRYSSPIRTISIVLRFYLVSDLCILCRYRNFSTVSSRPCIMLLKMHVSAVGCTSLAHLISILSGCI